MKSLLWKDFITMKKYLRLMAIMLAFYVVLFGFLVKDVTIASLMLTVIVTIVPTATFSYDEPVSYTHLGRLHPGSDFSGGGKANGEPALRFLRRHSGQLREPRQNLFIHPAGPP